MATGRLLDVSRHESGPAHAGRAKRVDVQSQLRGPAGEGRPYPPRLATRRSGNRRPRHAVQPRRPRRHPTSSALRPRAARRRRDDVEGATLMERFTVHTGTAVPLRRSNVDTDQIIPAVYLKRVSRTGFEDGLFSAWR